MNGSQAGKLIAGHNYSMVFQSNLQAVPDGDAGASAVGKFTLTIGEAAAGVVPEPLSLFVWDGLIVVVGVRCGRPAGS
jgi:hypothetical protein